MINNHLPGFRRYLTVLEGLADSSVAAYSQKVEEFNIWLAGNDDKKPAAEIIRQDIENYLEWCFYRGNANITRYTKLTALRKFFRYLVYEKIIEQDMTKDIPSPKLTKKLMQTFSRDEALRFFQQCDNTKEKGIRDICILILAAFCGLRTSEIINLTLNDISDNSKDIDIFVHGKKGRERKVYLWKVPAQYIRQYLLIRISHGAKGAGPFLSSYNHSKPKYRQLTHAAIDTLLKLLASKAGIRRASIHAHMFRSTHANDLQQIKGYTISAIQERMGWQDLSTAGRYLVRRERVHHIYNSLHEYWFEFTKLWKIPVSNEGGDDASNNSINGGAGDAEKQ